MNGRLSVLVMTLVGSLAAPATAQDGGVTEAAAGHADASAADAGPGARDAGASPSDAGARSPDAAPRAHDATPPGDIDELGDDAFVLDEQDLVENEAEDQSKDEAAAGADADRAPTGEAGEPSVMPEDQDLYEMREVVVTHSREDLFRTGGSAQIVDEETLETYENDDIHQIMLQVPGVYVRGEDGYGLRPNIGLRGASAERSKKITLMEDGVPLAPAPYSASAAYYFPIPTRMTSIEVFKGPSTVRYGPHTVGGSINLITRDVPDPGQQKYGIDLAGGTNLYGKAHGYYGAAGEHVGVLAEGVALHSNGFKELDGGGDTGFGKQEVMLKVRGNTDPSDYVYHTVELKLGFTHEQSNETYLGLTDEDFAQTPNRRYAASQRADFEWDRTQLQLRHKAQVGDFLDVISTAYRHDFARTWTKLNRFRDGPALVDILRDPEAPGNGVFYDVLRGESGSGSGSGNSGQALVLGSNARDFVSQGIQTRARLRLETGEWDHQIQLGLRFHNDEADRFHTEEGYEMIARTEMESARLVPDDRGETVTKDSLGEARAFATHLMYGLSFRGLTLKPGLRTELIFTERKDDLEGRPCEDGCDNKQRVFLPGMGAQYAITPELAVLAGVYQGFSPVAPGQPDQVEPEKSANYEWGVRYQTDVSHFEAIGFFNDYENLVGQCRFSVGCTDRMIDRQFNAGEVHVFGAELVAAHTLQFGKWQVPLRLTYTFTDSEFQKDFESGNPQFGEVKKGDELPYVPHHQAGFRAGVAMGERWSAHLSATYVGTMRETAGPRLPFNFIVDRDPDLTDDYVLLDLVARVRVLRSLRLYIKADNVLDVNAIASRRPFGARPTRPFQAQIGIKYGFQ